MNQSPTQNTYDVIIIGGAMIGSSIAWFLTANKDFDGTILVVERDPTYEWTSTVHTNSCIRQQFSNAINVQISQFGAEFIRSVQSQMPEDPEVPEIGIQEYGYLYLATSEAFAKVLAENQKIQNDLGAATRLLDRNEIAEAYPFYNLEDVIVGSHNTVNEGYFDGGTLFDCWRRNAKRNGAEYIHNEVVAFQHTTNGIEAVTLSSGETVTAGTVINATGPRAAITARMAGIELPVEPRKRYTFVFDAAKPLDRDLPLTIDPSGVHVRTDGKYYLCGCPPEPEDDVAVEPTDFEMDHSLWENKVWPALAYRIPAFEAIKPVNQWVGHYAYNTLDQNAILGPHPDLSNFVFANGFSGHGFQQSPAVGRGISEIVTYGEYRSLDLSPLSFERVLQNRPFLEKAVI